jgi:predicted metal-dependent phosphoesterase TrpH
MGLCDPHVHTTFSDGRHSPADVVDQAVRLPGLDMIAITDHDCLEGALVAARYAESSGVGLRVIAGEEVSSREGHIVGLFLHELIAPGMSANDTVRAIHDQGGLAIAVHPCRSTGVGAVAAQTLPFDAVELLNGARTPRARAANRRVARLPLGGRAVTGGSDAHVKEMLAACATAFPGSGPEEFREAIRDARTRPVTRPVDLVPYLRYALRKVARNPKALRELWPNG